MFFIICLPNLKILIGCKSINENGILLFLENVHFNQGILIRNKPRDSEEIIYLTAAKLDS